MPPADPATQEHERHLWSRARGHAPVLMYAAALVAGSYLMLDLIGSEPRTPTNAPSLPWPVLAVLFFAVEAKALHVEIRRETHSISLSGIPLLMGLLMTSPLGLVAARLVGSAAALTIVRRSPTVKLLWNLALFTAETSTAIAIARFALADGAPDDLASWSLLSAAILAAEVVGLVAVPLVIMLFDRELQPGLFAQIGRSHLIALVGATFAVVVAGAILHTPALALFAITPVLGVAGLLHVHGRLSKEHHDLQQLHGFTAAIGGRDSLDAGLRELTSILRTRGSALAIRRDDTYQVRCFVSGSLIDRQMTASGQPLDLGSGVAVVSADPRSEHPADDTSRRLLECVRGRSGLATPVALSSQESGLLLVFDRLGATTRYAPEERQLFASMATTLGARMSADLLLDRLELQAREDGLTGLANRAALENALDRRLGHLTRRGAVLVMDLDRFKDVNDTLGHQFGDQLLQVISARLLSAVGEVDLAARLGGDEFAVLLDEIASDAEFDVRLDLLARQFDRPVELDGITFDVGVSMGVASWPADGETSADLLRRADIAMYEAKRTHQSWVRYRPAIDHSSTRRLQVMGQLREAIERREMTLHYQPQVRADDSCLIGAEALVRWNHPTLGLIPPGEFVTLAEHSGVAAELTRFVLGEAIDATARLRRAGIDLVMAVNLTSRDILDANLTTMVARLLAKRDLSGSALALEITESSLIVDLDRAIENLKTLRAIGCRTSVDDFGTGYASLRYLQQLPLDEVKLDRSFVAASTTSPGDEAIVRSTTRLMHDLGMEVVAEGVEDMETLALMKEIGCDIVQGFLISRPLPLERFIPRALRLHDTATNVVPIGDRRATRSAG